MRWLRCRDRSHIRGVRSGRADAGGPGCGEWFQVERRSNHGLVCGGQILLSSDVQRHQTAGRAPDGARHQRGNPKPLPSSVKKTAGRTVRRRSASSRSKFRPPTCFVYVLGSRERGGPRTYVGWTVDLDQRLARHNAGTGARSTRGRQWVLLYAEGFTDRRKAMSREWHLKRDRVLRRALRMAVD